jgi:hypothetical protein
MDDFLSEDDTPHRPRREAPIPDSQPSSTTHHDQKPDQFKQKMDMFNEIKDRVKNHHTEQKLT